ncbi:MAG TPA: GNAT family N-acetyltransferase [Casimicrobiaceae bacterium]|nr:GNAT family N-acetyltransferase [Casimicrobiaceae bacterium]
MARRADAPALHEMILALAAFENLTAICVATAADIEDALFGPKPGAEALIASKNGRPAGFALFFQNFSTFLGRRGLWLEDLFVRDEYRRRGCATALLCALAAIAQERRCGRFEWAVLDWNTRAIDFYQGLGAKILPDWRIVRVVGPALGKLAGTTPEQGTRRSPGM